MTDINFDVQTPDVPMNAVPTNDVLAKAVQTAELWRARPGAFSPRSAFPGTGVSGVGGGTVGSGTVGSGTVGGDTAPCVVERQVPRVPGKAALAFPVPQSAILAKLGHINNYNHMTSVYAVGAGASGPPPYREPA